MRDGDVSTLISMKPLDIFERDYVTVIGADKEKKDNITCVFFNVCQGHTKKTLTVGQGGVPRRGRTHTHTHTNTHTHTHMDTQHG